MARNRSRFIRPAPRTSLWIGASVVDTAVAANTEVLLTSLSAAALLLRPFTIIRTRIRIWWSSDQAAASEEPAATYGRIVVKDEAVAIGITAVPQPVSTPEAQWFVYEGMKDSFVFGTAVGFAGAGSAVNHYDVDSRAMRKVGINEDLISVVQNATAVGASIRVTGRTLIKLH